MNFLGKLRILAIASLALAASAHAQSGALPTIPTAAIAEPAAVAPKTEDIEEQQRNVPARTVYIALAKVKNSKRSDIQIKPFDQHWAEPYKFHVAGSEIRVRLTPGKYQIRTRSVAQQGLPGQWSPWSAFWVHFKPVTAVYPADGTVIDPAGNSDEKITFEWPNIPGAKRYLVKLRNEQGEVIKEFRTRKPWLTVPVKVNSKYSWGIAPFTSTKELPTFVFNEFFVQAPNLLRRSLYFAVEEKKDVKKYQYEFVKIINERQTSEPSVLETHTADLRTRMNPGEYEMRVRSFYEDGAATDWSAPFHFFVKHLTPKPIYPKPEELVEVDDPAEGSVRLKWEKAEGAARYKVYIFDDDGKFLFAKDASKNEVEVPLAEKTKYKWKVVAYQEKEPDRGLASVTTPEDLNNLSTGVYERYNLTPAEEPGQFYGWGRLVGASIAYQGLSFDNNAKVKNSILGNSGELGLGYWHRKTNFGLLGHVGMYGFRPPGQLFLGQNYGVHLGYRKIFDNGYRLRVWGGATYNDIPEFEANPSTKVFVFSHVKNLGPQVQVSLLGVFNQNWGWHAYSSLYYGMIDLGTPNGMPQLASPSYQLSVQGTYKFSERYTGMAGYMYKAEHASYLSNDGSGRADTVDFSGHYFSLWFEFAIGKPKP